MLVQNNEGREETILQQLPVGKILKLFMRLFTPYNFIIYIKP
jgi:hypothetical protein